MTGIKRLAAFWLVFLLLTGTCLEVMAATKPINNVSIKVSSELEAGNRLPNIDVGSDKASEGGVAVSTSGSQYSLSSAEWTDKSSAKVMTADAPTMKVVLEPTDVSEHYFLASYKRTNIRVNGGEFVSARRNGDALEVTLRISPVKGSYDSPKDAFWNEKNLGEARWEQPENDSGYYDVQLLRDGKNVHRLTAVSSRNYNFYPYMTEPGDYMFKVRTVAGTSEQKKYGKNSDWLDSGELQITDRYVSDGKGQQSQNPSTVKGTEDKIGWFQEDDIWKYRYPNGGLAQNGWAMLNGQWYLFDEQGRMLNGWQQKDGYTYLLHTDGAMVVGWFRLGETWYYFRPETEYPAPAGSMVSGGWRVIGPYYYYFNADGSLYTGWLTLNNKKYYLNTLDNGLQGAMFTGWIIRDGKTYFADANGEIAEGWYKIDGLWYYFYPETGEMARSTFIDGLPIGEDGVWR